MSRKDLVFNEEIAILSQMAKQAIERRIAEERCDPPCIVSAVCYEDSTASGRAQNLWWFRVDWSDGHVSKSSEAKNYIKGIVAAIRNSLTPTIDAP